MGISLPDKITENSLDDVQSVDFDIDSLFNKFIAPIDAVRSMAAPAMLQISRGKDEDGKATQRELDFANVDNSSAQESRTHAFYRSIGLPVIDQDGNIYNPGFNPKRTDKERTQNNSIADRVAQPVKMMAQARETNVRTRLATFQRQGLDASVYALVLPIFKKFQVIDANKTFDTQDDQQFSIPRRKLFVSSNYTNSDGSDITNFFDSGNHFLRPMVCDASIERTVMPASRLICEPFLASPYDTVLELDTFLQRPKIEQVLRLRLSSSDDSLSTLDESVFLLDPVLNTENLSLPDLRRIASALLDNNKIADQDILDKIGINSVELLFVNNIVRTIKAVVDLLIDAVETISDVSKNIDWTPLPSNLGPQFGTDIGSFTAKQTASSELERRILQLSLKAQNSSRQFSAGQLNLGAYALSSYDNMDKLFDDELSTAKEQRLEYIRRGSNALKTIEIITGEISGLGLIDVLAVYAALWSADIDVILSLLDQNAFQRLYDNNVSLRNTNVELRNGSGPKFGGSDAVNRFEKQVTNILAFADRLVDQKLASPKLAEGGSI